MLKQFLKGKGVDLSKEPFLKGTTHFYLETDNLYRPYRSLGFEAFDFAYSRALINESKYYRILLYEWFHLIRAGGRIIIEFQENEILSHQDLIKELAILNIYKDNHKVIYNEINESWWSVVIEKQKPVKYAKDEINHWTFGIITNGKRIDQIKKIINSLRRQNIPQYEVVVCGTYSGEIEEDMRYIPFSEKDDKGWITKKKNLICENAKYENICVIHDRIYFDDNWFEGMKQWGPEFEVLGSPIRVEHKDTIVDCNWEVADENFQIPDDFKLFHTNGTLDISDWDKNVHISGPIIILKKRIWQLQKWDEELFWGEAEDITLSRSQHRKGIMLRLNPLAIVYPMQLSGIFFHAHYEKNRYKLGKFRTGTPGYVNSALKFADFLGFRRNQKLVQYIIKRLKKLYNVHSWKEERKSYEHSINS